MILLILIYSGLSIVTEEKPTIEQCLIEAKNRIGEQAKVFYWDNMGGSNPIPKVSIAFCTQGYTNDRN